MNELTILTLAETEEWNSIVKKFNNYDSYYLPGYLKGFEIHGDGKPVLFYYNDGSTKAIKAALLRDVSEIQALKQQVSPNEYFDLTTPYGYGGFIIEGCNYDSVHKTYANYCVAHNIICEFIRLHPLLDNVKYEASFASCTKLGKTVFMDIRSKETIWSNLTSKNRNMIRKAKKSGIEVYWGRDPWLVNEFKKMYDETMARDQADQYYYFSDEFYASILKDLKYNSLFFYAKLKETILAMAIIVFGHDQIHYHLSASQKEYWNVAPTNLLLYEIACWGNENNYKTFHLGGGLGGKEDSLFNFKKSFNRNQELAFFIGKRIFNPDYYLKLVALTGNSPDSNYFPAYRISSP